MTREQLEKNYKNFPTSELLKIANTPSDYTPLAVEVAKIELETRDISQEDVEAFENKRRQIRKKMVKVNLEDDLTIWLKAFFYFLFKFPYAADALKDEYKKKGYILKLNQTNYYTVASIVFLLLYGLSALIYSSSVVSFFSTWIAGFILAYLYDENFNKENHIRKLKELYPDDKIEVERELFF